MRCEKSSFERNQYSRPSSSAGRRARVVADTVASIAGTRATSSLISVPLPAPEGPVTTSTGGTALAIEEPDQLRALPLGETADSLRRADLADSEEAVGLHAPGLRNGHEDVDDLRGLDVLRRLPEDRLDLGRAFLQVLLELRALDPDVVR